MIKYKDMPKTTWENILIEAEEKELLHIAAIAALQLNDLEKNKLFLDQYEKLSGHSWRQGAVEACDDIKNIEAFKDYWVAEGQIHEKKHGNTYRAAMYYEEANEFEKAKEVHPGFRGFTGCNQGTAEETTSIFSCAIPGETHREGYGGYMPTNWKHRPEDLKMEPSISHPIINPITDLKQHIKNTEEAAAARGKFRPKKTLWEKIKRRLTGVLYFFVK